MAQSYDVAVIGSGPGGYVAGIKAAQAGLKSLVVEKEKLGGVCLNWGCIPTKALLHNAELYEELAEGDALGFTFDNLGYDGAKIVDRSRRVADKMNRGVHSLFKKYKVDHLIGTAELTGPNAFKVTDAEGKTDQVQAKNVIVATGAKPRAVPGMEVDHKTVLNYRDAMQVKKFPKSLLVVGAGAIGVEFAYFFNAFGVEVHLVEMMPRILPNEDTEISDQLLKSFKKRGMHVYPSTKVENFKATKGKVSADLNDGKQTHKVNTEMALIAVGMQGQIEGIGLEAAGVRTEQGFIPVDEQMRTNAQGVYAIGDVTGRQLLAHKASAEAEAAVAAIAGHAHQPVDYTQIPACTYCQPQVASIGLTEEACKEKGLKIKVGRFPFAANGKANALRSLDGMVKVIYGEPYGELLGAHMIGPDVTELIAELGLAMKLEATYEEVLATVHAHPTLSESVFEASGTAYGLSANF